MTHPSRPQHRLAPLAGLALLGLLVLACDDTAFGEAGTGHDGLDAAWTCDSEANKAVFVIQQLAFSEAEDGVVWGFDLDDEVSEVGDSRGCGKGDFVDPEGTPGIDNAFAQLFPAIENTEAVAIHGLMQTAVNDGELLLVAEVLGLDDLVADDCVTVRFGTAVGTPMLGTDGYLLDGQTFQRHPELDPGLTEHTEVIDGSLTAGPLVANIELQVLDAQLAFAIAQGAIRLDLAPDGSEATGHFGGGFSVAYVLDVLANTGVDDGLTAVLQTALPLAADLDSDEGECAAMSVDLGFRAVPAFYEGE